MLSRSYQRTILCILSLVPALISCTTYEKTMVYHRGYDPGSDARLLFNGYYDDTVYEEFEAYGGRILKDPVRPMFFYKDGTAVLGGAMSNMDSVAAFIKRGLYNMGYWSNYKIIGDTIAIEFLTHNGGTGVMEVHTKRGILGNGTIHFPGQQSHKKQPVSAAYTVFFHPFLFKPDSTKNWIRQHSHYNKERN